MMFCKGCHGKKFGPKGYGFGQGAGALSTETGAQFGNNEGEMTYVFYRAFLFEAPDGLALEFFHTKCDCLASWSKSFLFLYFKHYPLY